MRPRTPFLLNDSGILIVAAIIMIIMGLMVMWMGTQPLSSGESSSEFMLKDGSYSSWELPGLGFREKVEGELVHHSPADPEKNISLYLLTEDDYQEFMEWLDENPNGNPAGKLDSLDLVHQENRTGNFSFELSTDSEGDLYLVLISNGGTQHFEVTIKNSSRVESGVCFSVSLVLFLIAIFLFRAASQVGRPSGQQVPNYNYYQRPPF
jgi:hypothetical protein